MSMTRRELLAEAMSLEPAEREALAEDLWLSLDGATQAGVDAAWMEEVKLRQEAYDRGEATASTVEEAIERILSRKRS